MKIYENHDDMLEAWMITTNALEAIKHTMLSNRICNEKVIAAYYELLTTSNDWYDEIKKMPF